MARGLLHHHSIFNFYRLVPGVNKRKMPSNYNGSSPFQSTWILYLMHFFFAFTSRMWDMGIVLLIAEITNNSLSLVALAGLCNNLFLVMFMTTLGKWLDRSNRLSAAIVALTVKLCTLSVAYFICYYVAGLQQANLPVHPGLIYSLPILSAIASLSFSTISQSVEKDWIVVLSNDDSGWLASTNSIMTQIDSGVNSFAPPITGFLFLYFRPSNAAIILLGINALSTVMLYFFMNSLYHSWPSLSADRAAAISAKDEERVQLTDDKLNKSQRSDLIESNNKRFYIDFLNSGCAGAMTAYAFLYMTVLSYGSLMTVYLRWSGMSDAMVGVLRGGAAFSGLMGAVVFPFVNRSFGLYYASVISIVYQFILVAFAASSFFLFENHSTVWILAIAVLLSRSGLWMFDLGIRQIAQETIPEDCRGVVNGQWRSMTAFFEMCSYLLGFIVHDPKVFWKLTAISAFMVFSAMSLFILSGPYYSKLELSEMTKVTLKYEPLKVEMKTTKHYQSINQDDA